MTPLVFPWKKGAKKFLTDDMLLPRSGWFFWLDEANFQLFRGSFITLPAILKPGVSELHEDFQFALRDTNRLESRLPGKSTDLRICDWRSGGKRKMQAFVVIFCRVLRMTGTLSGAIQTPRGIAMMSELVQGKLCWTVTTIPPLAGDLDGRTPEATCSNVHQAGYA